MSDLFRVEFQVFRVPGPGEVELQSSGRPFKTCDTYEEAQQEIEKTFKACADMASERTFEIKKVFTNRSKT